ncbi:hypothetical protein [Parashewanella tropica]|uniref:hypothetical protein n=1 Tax=Parashewanella tropica TaxID=2547970 RepID=UPI0010597CE1|nr:hypothetical protein [Parashewanella tropica]
MPTITSPDHLLSLLASQQAKIEKSPEQTDNYILTVNTNTGSKQYTLTIPENRSLSSVQRTHVGSKRKDFGRVVADFMKTSSLTWIKEAITNGSLEQYIKSAKTTKREVKALSDIQIRDITGECLSHNFQLVPFAQGELLSLKYFVNQAMVVKWQLYSQLQTQLDCTSRVTHNEILDSGDIIRVNPLNQNPVELYPQLTELITAQEQDSSPILFFYYTDSNHGRESNTRRYYFVQTNDLELYTIVESKTPISRQDFQQQQLIAEMLSKTQSIEVLPHCILVDLNAIAVAQSGCSFKYTYTQSKLKDPKLHQFKALCESMCTLHESGWYLNNLCSESLQVDPETLRVELSDPSFLISAQHLQDLKQARDTKADSTPSKLSNGFGHIHFNNKLIPKWLLYWLSTFDPEAFEVADTYCLLQTILESRSLCVRDMIREDLINTKCRGLYLPINRVLFESMLKKIVKPHYLEEVLNFLSDPVGHPLDTRLVNIIDWDKA